MKILTCTSEELRNLENAEEYDYIILINYGFIHVGHKCSRSAYAQWVTDNYRYFRWHSTKHCKVCHKTWPKEVQVTANMV